MITRRTLLGASAGVGVLTLVPGTAAHADIGRWTKATSANGWRIDATTIATHRIAGSGATVDLRQGDAAAILLHIARRWHYEIAPVDTGEGGGVVGYTGQRTVRADFESNYLSGTAICLHPTAYPIGGSERLWPHQEEIVRDILLDCAGTVAWGGDLNPVACGHFHLAARAGSKDLTRVAALLDTSRHTAPKAQTAGRAADPATPARRDRARTLPRRR